MTGLSSYFYFVDSSEVSFLGSSLRVLIIAFFYGARVNKHPPAHPCMRDDKWVGNIFSSFFVP
jgi:hypothetical protein